MATTTGARAALTRLAKLHGVQPSYRGADGSNHRVSDDSLHTVLGAMHVDTSTPAMVQRATRARAKELRSRVVEPVAVAWGGKLTLTLRLGEAASSRFRVTIELEDGSALEHTLDADAATQTTKRGPDGEPETITRLSVPGKLPMGYHRVRLNAGRKKGETLLLSAPRDTYRHTHPGDSAAWGLFCPLYALRSERDTGCGDLTELRRLAAWQATHGASIVATLPLLAVYLDEPFDPSPYSPVSRLFWNELFLDPTQTPEFAACAQAKSVVASRSWKDEVERLRAGALVQYRRQHALRRSVLEPMAEHFFDNAGDKSDAFKAFLADNPQAKNYARFRAVMERQRRDWADWSDRLRQGRFTTRDFDPRAERYHLYAQMRFTDQLRLFVDEMTARDGQMYLDLAVGVRGDGFDVFQHPELFAKSIDVGAPPDPFFTAGQSWGFPPMLPDEMRASGYRYFIDTIRSHMRFASTLRLDHVMAFFRLYWVPLSIDPTAGAYVHYHMDEQLAILAIESHRFGCQIAGENLGTVPKQVNTAMKKHGLSPLYVAQYEVKPDARKPIADVPPASVASSNTHDMPPFSKFWDGADVRDRVEIGIFDAALADSEKKSRERIVRALETFFTKQGEVATGDAAQARDAVHRHLARGPADLMLVNIEDLWLERHWQNMPGTVDEHANWRHRLRFELNEIEDDGEIARQMQMVNRARRSARDDRQTKDAGNTATSSST